MVVVVMFDKVLVLVGAVVLVEVVVLDLGGCVG